MASLHKLIVEAGEHNRNQCPVTVSISDAAFVEGDYRLNDEKSGKSFPCQVENTPDGLQVSWILPRLEAGKRQSLFLSKNPSPNPSRVLFENHPSEGRVEVRILGRPFTSYNYGPKWVRPFLYPVTGPNGTHVTRHWPMKKVKGEHRDHPHHKSIWVAYGDCDGVDQGIAVFDHPANPRFPTPWHVRNYGLMTANCFASSHYAPEAKLNGDMRFKKGQETTWSYRVYIHCGNAQQGKVSSRYLDYFAPPKVKVD